MSQSIHYVSGRLGVDPGFTWPSESDATIDADADGQFGTPSKWYIDLSHALSRRLGRQLPQTATYRVVSMEIGLRNKDDTVDNDQGSFFGGTLFYQEPTSYKVDGLQLARAVEKADESGQVDADSFLLSTDRDYSGMRFNWDADSQVSHATAEGFTSLTGAEWDMEEVLSIYGGMVEPANNYSNALWGRRTGTTAAMQWAACICNNAETYSALDDYGWNNPSVTNWTWTAPAGYHIPVLLGLLKGTVSHSNTDTTGIIDDDYEIQVTVGVAGWDAF